MGKVYIIGAGPGDPDLITYKAVNILKKCDVILVDRLVSKEILRKFVSSNSKIIYVGKQCSKGIYTKQSLINKLLIVNALKNKVVVRLKGGDISIFSNILDELDVLVNNNISYELIPGISSSLGAAAYSGIPLTARGYSNGIRFLTLCDSVEITENTWNDWINTDNTLVYYMSGLKLNYLIKKFKQNPSSKDKYFAIIQQATTPFQKTTIYKFKDIIESEFFEFNYTPLLIIVGDVVKLHTKFSWINESGIEKSYFDNPINDTINVH